MAEETHHHDHCDHHYHPRFFRMMRNKSCERCTDQDDCKPSCSGYECPSSGNPPPMCNRQGQHGPNHGRQGPCRFDGFDDHGWHHERFGHRGHCGPFAQHQYFGHRHHFGHHGSFEHGRHGHRGHQCRHQGENPSACIDN
ncbi:histidine-rich glycoprotein-like [Zophobas morio]|uniref:histidine-rich glycoprotein-like n=1 Tax=Zophobas morio TaxID=2755281 RepID=UPI0030828E1A